MVKFFLNASKHKTAIFSKWSFSDSPFLRVVSHICRLHTIALYCYLRQKQSFWGGIIFASVCLSVRPSVRLSVCPSVRLSVCHQNSGKSLARILTKFCQNMYLPLRRKPINFEISMFHRTVKKIKMLPFLATRGVFSS